MNKDFEAENKIEMDRSDLVTCQGKFKAENEPSIVKENIFSNSFATCSDGLINFFLKTICYTATFRPLYLFTSRSHLRRFPMPHFNTGIARLCYHAASSAVLVAIYLTLKASIQAVE